MAQAQGSEPLFQFEGHAIPNWTKGSGPTGKSAGPLKDELRLPLAGIAPNLVRANDLSMERAGNQRFAFDFAGLGVGDIDAVDLKGAADGALVAGFGFGQIRQGAQLAALS